PPCRVADVLVVAEPEEPIVAGQNLGDVPASREPAQPRRIAAAWDSRIEPDTPSHLGAKSGAVEEDPLAPAVRAAPRLREIDEPSGRPAGDRLFARECCDDALEPLGMLPIVVVGPGD